MDSRFRLTWSTRKNGYRWAKEKEDPNDPLAVIAAEFPPQLYLVPVIDDDASEPYSPLSVPGLCFLFTDLPVPVTNENEDVLLFANRYGLLRERFGMIESFRDWENEIQLMRQAVWLWEKYRANDEIALSDCIRWRNGRPIFSGIYGTDGRERDYTQLAWEPNAAVAQIKAMTDGGPVPEHLPQKFKPGDVIGPAKSFVSWLISERLNVEVSAAFGPDGISFNLKTLVGAMWVQFAEAVSGKAEYIRCAIPSCRTWVLVKEKAKGKGKMYCSDRCKKRAQRQRRSSQ